MVVQRIAVEVTAGEPGGPAVTASGADDRGEGGEARFAAELEVVVQGHPQEPLPLPLELG